MYLSNVEALYLFHELKILSIIGIENSIVLYHHFYNLFGLEFVKEYIVYRLTFFYSFVTYIGMCYKGKDISVAYIYLVKGEMIPPRSSGLKNKERLRT